MKYLKMSEITANAIYRPNQDDLDAMYSVYDNEFYTEDWA